MGSKTMLLDLNPATGLTEFWEGKKGTLLHKQGATEVSMNPLIEGREYQMGYLPSNHSPCSKCTENKKEQVNEG